VRILCWPRDLFFCGVGRPWLCFVDTCTNKSDCSGGLTDSRTDYLLLIDAFGSTRSCGQHGYLAATHHPPRWRIIRVRSNQIRNLLADTVLDSIRIRLVFARMDSRYLDSCPTLVRKRRASEFPGERSESYIPAGSLPTVGCSRAITQCHCAFFRIWIQRPPVLLYLCKHVPMYDCLVTTLGDRYKHYPL
jgi:hypothetical protein